MLEEAHERKIKRKQRKEASLLRKSKAKTKDVLRFERIPKISVAK